MQKTIGDVGIELKDHVGIVEIQRPPHNFFDSALIKNLSDAFDEMDENADCRAVVLCAQGKSFCAGANFQANNDKAQSVTKGGDPSNGGELYREAVRLYSNKKPVVGAIQGAAIGGGLGVALVPDFRVTCPEGRFAANFVKLGFHPGFGLTARLPQLVGEQKANLLFYTGRRIKGEEAVEWGLADILTTQDKVREEAINLAKEIAENGPLGVQSTRATMRQGLAELISKQTDHELHEQNWLRKTEDHQEGVRAVGERRPGNFVGR
jgi:enoyl-CoA hydratase/carnithine racemase